MSNSEGVMRADRIPPLAVFTDFDGTLVEIAPAPDAVDVPEDLARDIELARMSFDGAMAVVSGRAIQDLDRYLPQSLPVAGGHGSERRRADGTFVEPPPERVAAATAIADRLEPFAGAHRGLILERKASAVALHYRLAPEHEAEALQQMTEAIADAPEFGVIQGKMVVEARPLETSKGAAVRAFMQEAPFSGRFPVFIGDDLTDEDGFIAAQDLGGIGVKVGDGETVARLRTPDVGSALAIIRGLAARADAARSAKVEA
jgi:trehalose 6-phosphate phosphatase